MHVLRGTESGRPAGRAGVKDGDLLLEVNGESVESLKHREVVERVRQSGQKVSVTTITPQGLEFYTKVGGRGMLIVSENLTPQDKDARLLSCSWVCRLCSSVRRILMKLTHEAAAGGPLSRQHGRKRAIRPNPDSVLSRRARWGLAFSWAPSQRGLGPSSAR